MSSRKCLIGAVLLLAGCAVSSPIKKVGESQSEFSDDPAKTIKPSKGNLDVYRVYDRAATGFVSIGAVREGLEDRARKFCVDQGKALQVVASEQSNPPYILGNFPRMELIFTCMATSLAVSGDRIGKLGSLKTLLDNGTLTQAEFDAEKRRILSGQ